MEAEKRIKFFFPFRQVMTLPLAIVLMVISNSQTTAAYGSANFASTINPCILINRKVNFSPLRRLGIANKRTESRPLLGLRHVSARLRDEELDAVAIDIITAVSAACSITITLSSADFASIRWSGIILQPSSCFVSAFNH